MRLFDSCPMTLARSLPQFPLSSPFPALSLSLSPFLSFPFICAAALSSILVDLARSPFSSPLYTTRLTVAPSFHLLQPSCILSKPADKQHRVIPLLLELGAGTLQSCLLAPQFLFAAIVFFAVTVVAAAPSSCSSGARWNFPGHFPSGPSMAQTHEYISERNNVELRQL